MSSVLRRQFTFWTARASAYLEPESPEPDSPAPAPAPSTQDESVSPPAAAYTIRLALTYPNWVNRRVERFDFVDARTVRRQMSVDFALPHDEELEAGQQVLVPVMMLRRGVLRRLDVTDGDGCSLNVVESEQGREVAIRGLMEFLTPPSPEPGTEILKKALDALLRREGEDDGAKAQALRLSDRPIRAALADYDAVQAATVRALIGELSEGFMLLVSVPYRPHVRMLVKVGYDAKLETSLGQLRRGLRERPRAERAYVFFGRVFSAVGLMGRTEYFTDLPVRLGKSHHVEVAPPPGTYAEEASLVIEGRVKRDYDHSRPHLWVRGGFKGTDRGELGTLAVILHARREVSVFPLFFSSALIAGVLAFVSKQAELDRVDGITLGAILLAPVALAAYYARSEENQYLTVILRGVRRLATLAVLVGVVVIALLALGSIEPQREAGKVVTSDSTALLVTRWAARVAIFCTVALGMAMLAPVLDEWTRNASIPDRSDSESEDYRFGMRELLWLLLPPYFLLGIGAVIIFAAFQFLPK